MNRINGLSGHAIRLEAFRHSLALHPLLEPREVPFECMFENAVRRRFDQRVECRALDRKALSEHGAHQLTPLLLRAGQPIAIWRTPSRLARFELRPSAPQRSWARNDLPQQHPDVAHALEIKIGR